MKICFYMVYFLLVLDFSNAVLLYFLTFNVFCPVILFLPSSTIFFHGIFGFISEMQCDLTFRNLSIEFTTLIGKRMILQIYTVHLNTCEKILMVASFHFG